LTSITGINAAHDAIAWLCPVFQGTAPPRIYPPTKKIKADIQFRAPMPIKNSSAKSRLAAASPANTHRNTTKTNHKSPPTRRIQKSFSALKIASAPRKTTLPIDHSSRID
jgi:hypothetical protein